MDDLVPPKRGLTQQRFTEGWWQYVESTHNHEKPSKTGWSWKKQCHASEKGASSKKNATLKVPANIAWVEQATLENFPAILLPKKWARGMLMHLGSTHPHVSWKTADTIATLGFQMLPYLPYSPGLAPSDYHLFGANENLQAYHCPPTPILFLCAQSCAGFSPSSSSFPCIPRFLNPPMPLCESFCTTCPQVNLTK